MIEYESPFDDEFTADCDYWDNFQLPWNDDDEDLNIESLLHSKNDF